MSLERQGDCDVFIIQAGIHHGYHLKTKQGREENKGGDDTCHHVHNSSFGEHMRKLTEGNEGSDSVASNGRLK